MAAEIHQSVARRAAILRILGESTVRNQDELVKVLRKEGFEATQSSVSRDLRELGVAKAGDHYILPGGDTSAAGTPFAAVSNFVTAVRTAGPSLTSSRPRPARRRASRSPSTTRTGRRLSLIHISEPTRPY